MNKIQNVLNDEESMKQIKELADMLTADNGGQGDLFLSSEEFDEELGAYVPKPVKEYKPIEYWRIQCLI